MKYIKKFEAVTDSNLAINDKDYVNNLKENITSIFLDLLDDDFNLHFHITDYGGNVSHIKISNPNFLNASKIEDFLPSIEHFYEYIKSEGYVFYHINLQNKWILGGPNATYCERDRAISFTQYEWEEIKEILIERSDDKRVSNISIDFVKR